MKLLLLSDLHLELGASFTLPAGLDFDAVVLAGDIHSPGRKAVHWARRESTFGGKPVVYVPGNHEFYGAPNFAHELDEMRRAAEGTNVHLLDRDSVIVGGVRFLGCMLWTDFQLPIRNGSVMDTDVGHALLEANRDVNDFRCINVIAPATRENRYREFKRLLRAEDTLALHWVDRDWLRRELKKPFGGPTAVVTHHAPSNESVAEKYAGDKLTPAFVSQLPDEFFEGPELWLHGHTHTAADYIRRRCRVVSNPRGYRLRDSSFENHQFDPGLVIETTPRSSSEQAVDASVAAGGKDSEEARLACQAHLDELSARADMADTAAAAMLAGVAAAQLVCWASATPPLVIALRRAEGWRFPRWQFAPAVWPVARQLAQALGGGALSALNWLETPHGAFGGRTPRAALEQGEAPDRVLALASAED